MKFVIKFALLFCFSVHVFATTTQLAPKCEIDVVTELLEPYQIELPDGSVGGYSTDIVNALFAEASCQAKIQTMSWARAYEVARKQPNTMIYSIAHTERRENNFAWVGSLLEERLYFWGLKETHPMPVEDEAQLKNKRIAASRHSNVAQYLEDKNFAKVYHLIKEDQNMLMLYRGRVDLIVATEMTLQNRAKKLGLDFGKIHKIKEVTYLNNDLCIAFNKDTDPAIIRSFKSAYQRLIDKGTLDQIKDKWHIYHQ